MLWAQHPITKALFLFLALYGLWVLALTLWRKFYRRQKPKKPFISILVVARNHEVCIEGIVRWLIGLDYVDEHGSPNLEIVAISSGSDDQTPAILERLCREEPRLTAKSVPAARAYEEGLDLCRGDVICLLDLSKQVVPKAGYAMERMLYE
ncbi:MAG: glycosyltransferase [bacterium]|jgi:cellulose synthase/poly-beta-1,6-N-acetylglucosamine synthase-like glycosyltransferase